MKPKNRHCVFITFLFFIAIDAQPVCNAIPDDFWLCAIAVGPNDDDYGGVALINKYAEFRIQFISHTHPHTQTDICSRRLVYALFSILIVYISSRMAAMPRI